MRRFLPVIFGIALGLCAIAAIFIGVISIPGDVVWASLLQKIGLSSSTEVPDFYDITLWQLRLPRIIMSLLAGGVLAICGCVFQSIFHNPICDPYVLGISSGASLGAAVAIILGWDTYLFGITLPALATSVLTLLFIIGIAKLQRQHSTQTLLLVGIALNFLISAVITLLLVVHQQDMQKIIFWTMGSLATTSWKEIAWLLPIMIAGISILYFNAKNLNILQLGTETAQSLGVNARRTTYVTLITSSVLIGTVVSFCGVIGFIGLVVPHIARLIFGSNNRHLFTYSLFFGAFFMLLADTLARTIASPAELPIGSITALAGAPFFVYLLIKK